MPYVNVHVDADDVLDDLSIEEIESYLKSRKKDKLPSNFNPAIPMQVAYETLESDASLCRKHGRPDLAFKLDEVRVDIVDPLMPTARPCRYINTPTKLGATP